ncbi:MAG: AEC family transporter [Rhodocyclaceae bacterium]|nr:AEC family transporter [Rhodocyclaceae bacterium]MBX3671097.1 AEC family transporter [Rhodocyclaceae bacterium]
MNAILRQVLLATPLFALILLGYALVRLGKWPKSVADALSRFVFSVGLPALLFRMMLGMSALPAVDARLLIAFFGGCFIVFALGRLLAAWAFRLDGAAQSVFALAGIFSNNGMLGLPLAKSMLGDAALPAVALVIVFNGLTLWTLVSVSVEWARHGSPDLRGFVRTFLGVLKNPIVASILSGALLGLAGFKLPELADQSLAQLGQAATPLSLVALGMGLGAYGIGSGFTVSLAMAGMKLVVQPLVVWGLARLLHLPLLETQAIVLLASVATGVNVYLMAQQFKTQEAQVASALVLSTALSALTTPLALGLVAAAG